MAKKDERLKICGSAGLADREDTLTPEVLVRKYASLVLGFCLAHTKNTRDDERRNHSPARANPEKLWKGWLDKKPCPFVNAAERKMASITFQMVEEI